MAAAPHVVVVHDFNLWVSKTNTVTDLLQANKYDTTLWILITTMKRTAAMPFFFHKQGVFF